jgi:4-hydroxy-4-methyl-2-oxoglutarate aldolase
MIQIHTLVSRLRALDTCAVSDALDRLGYPGTVTGIRPLTIPKRIAGEILTVKLKIAEGQQSRRHLGTNAVTMAEPGNIIVIEHGAPDLAAGWGGILSTASHLRGISGVIVDGAIRDVDEAKDIGFPVYARSSIPFTARGRIIEESSNEPIQIGGVPVNPGDLVIADSTGVVFVSKEHAEQIVSEAEGIARREAQMTRDILAGLPVTEVMGGNYESMLKQ